MRGGAAKHRTSSVDAGQERSSKAWAEVSECTEALWVVMVMLSDVYNSGHGMQDTARTQLTVYDIIHTLYVWHLKAVAVTPLPIYG